VASYLLKLDCVATPRIRNRCTTTATYNSTSRPKSDIYRR